MAFRVRKVVGTYCSLNEWLSGSEKSSGLSRNAPQRSEIFSSSFATAWIAPKTAITSTLCLTPKLKHMAFANIAYRLTILSPSLWSLEKPVVKVRPGYSINLVLSYVVKEVKLKITVKCRSSGRLRFEDTKTSGLSRRGPHIWIFQTPPLVLMTVMISSPFLRNSFSEI